MALPHRDQAMNVEEFLKLRESDPDHRYEYIDGEIYMMTGGSVRHSRVAFNLSYILENLLEDRPCIVYNSDVCFQAEEEGFVCPDVTVSCDPRDSDEKSEEENLQFVHHPCFVAEVLSPGTIERDRGLKAALYQEHPTLREFLLVEIKAPKVQLYRRESNNRWTIHLLTLEDHIELSSLGVRFPVTDLYKKTRFSRGSTE